MFELILDSKILYDELITLELLISRQCQINSLKQTEYYLSSEVIMYTNQAQSKGHQLNRVLIV